MLIIYNESTNPWGIKTLSQRVGSLFTERVINKNNQSVTKRTDVIISNDLGDINLAGYTEMDTPAIIYGKNTNVRFQQKDERALVCTGEKFNTDVIAMSIKLEGRIIKDFIKTSNINCLNYVIAGGELSMVVAIKETSNPADKTTFAIVLHDNKTKTDTTYTFTKDNMSINGYVVTKASEEVETAIERPSFKLAAYRPSRVTRLVFVNEADEAVFSSVYNPKTPGEIFTIIDDANMSIEDAKAEKFRAATLFVNADETTVSRKDFKEYNELVELIKKNFRTVNILLNNGHIIKL